MKYMLLIYDREDWWETVTPEQMAAEMEAHVAFGEFLKGRGAEYSGEALHPSKTATTLRPSGNGDELMITDGPFVDLKEHLGGFYIFEAVDLDDAIAVARKCPAARGLEVRPVVDFSQ